MSMTIEYVATCLFGLEKFVSEEIEALGYEKGEVIDGRVSFKGGIDAIARCNIGLRTAERLYIKMGSFPARTFDELFENTKALPWEDGIGKDDAFPVSGHSIKSALFSLPDCQSIVKKAIVDRLSAEYGIRWFTEEGAKMKIEFFLLNDRATLMIDTSGVPLHKRGYRPEAGAAPLRETLAAAMVKMSRPRENVLLWDPFCGSGTIAIEAACLMTDTSPGVGRRYAAEDFFDVPESVWVKAREEALDRVRPTDFEAFASDIDPQMVETAKANIARAGMEKYIKCFVKDALTIEKPDRRGTIVCNPPYGERLMTHEEVARLYRGMGRTFSSLAPWQIYVLSSADDFEHLYGKRADKVKRMYNGMIKCGLFQYFKQK